MFENGEIRTVLAPFSKQFCSDADHFKSKVSRLRGLKIYLPSAAILHTLTDASMLT